MAPELRDTGISVVGDVPWGTHFCSFYDTKQDLLDILIPFFKTGLKNNEFCLWIVSSSELLTTQEARNALQGALPDLDQYVGEKSIEFAGHDWFLDGGSFDFRRVANRFKEKGDEALARGYIGMRVNGSPAWLETSNGKELRTFEAEVDKLYRHERIIASCTYPISSSRADFLLDVARNHRFAIARRQGIWDIVETPELMQAKAEIERLNAELEQKVIERTKKLEETTAQLRAEIEERKEAEEAVRQNEEKLQANQELLDLAQKAARAMAFDWHIQESVNTWSPEQEALYGLAPGTFDGTYESWKKLVHPEDWPLVVKALRHAQETGDISAEFRVIWPDGSTHWLAANGQMLFDDQGQPLRMVGFTADCTSRVQSRIALEEALTEIKLLKDELFNENLALRDEVDRVSMFEEIVGTSRPLRTALSLVIKVAPNDSTVLITGETGTGKELFARAIHKRSQRAFVSVNCAALAPSLISSELFGHEKGAFTSAVQRRIGRFESANGGTIFLDEVGELPAETQVALLRVLQEREFERLGSNQPISVDVRVVAATNRDLEAAVAAGTFREDLFYRLNVFPLQIPSLRERVDDIPLLVEYFIERYAKKAGKKIKTITKKTLDLFRAYNWPGNIRELQNVVERAVIVCDDEIFSVDQKWLKRDLSRESHGPRKSGGSLSRDADRERALIEAALAESRGQIAGASGAARKLAIPRQTLDSKIRSLGIDKLQFRRG